MAPNFPQVGRGSDYQSFEQRFLKQPFRPGHQQEQHGPLKRQLAEPPNPHWNREYTNPAPGPGQKNFGFYGVPGRVPLHLAGKLGKQGLMFALARNPYLRLGMTLFDLLDDWNGFQMSYPFKGWDMGYTGMTKTLDCVSLPLNIGASQLDFGPPAFGSCPTLTLVPQFSLSDASWFGGLDWSRVKWVMLGNLLPGAVRFRGTQEWRVIGSEVARHPLRLTGWGPDGFAWPEYNPYNPDTMLPGLPYPTAPTPPYKVLPDRVAAPDGRNAPARDNGPDNRPPKPPVIRRHPWGPDWHYPKPPGPGVKERKFTPKSYQTWKALADLVVGPLTELSDWVTAAYDALPWQVRRWKGRDGKWRDKDATLQDRIKRLYDNADKIDLSKFAKNALKNQAEDAVFGKLGSKQKDAIRQAAKQGYWGGLLGTGAGPAF